MTKTVHIPLPGALCCGNCQFFNKYDYWLGQCTIHNNCLKHSESLPLFFGCGDFKWLPGMQAKEVLKDEIQ